MGECSVTKLSDPLHIRCIEIADCVVPQYRNSKNSYSCGGPVAKRWQSAFDAAKIALTEPQPVQTAEAIEHFTCATDHLAAERTLRIVECATQWGSIDSDTIDTISALVDRAGPARARAALERQFDALPF
jgi:hypothetical protein